MVGKRWEEMLDTLSTDLANADKLAQSITQGYMYDAYALNHNYATFLVEQDSLVDTSYTLYDRQTVERLIRDEPNLLPAPTPGSKRDRELREGRIERWNAQKITSEVTQGILQGESVDKIASRMRNVAAMGSRAARRNARTAVTGAENAGRQAGFERAQDMGIDTEKQWLATMDDRTRHEHRLLDGVHVPVDEDFEVDGYKIEYPGDPSAEPEMVYNCRCTMICRIKGFEKDFTARHNDALGDMTYEEWKHQLEKKPAEGKEETPVEHTAAYEKFIQRIEASNIDTRDVGELDHNLTSEEIVDKVGGGDLTKGSCSSLTYAYIGNECGYDVYDFRDGKSREFFAHATNESIIRDFDGIEKQVYIVDKEASDVAKKLKELDLPYGEEYRLTCGRHAAIIRNTEYGYQYLELQNANNNGWKSFMEKETLKYIGRVDGTPQFETVTEKCSVTETLKKRFGCKVSKSKTPIIEDGKLKLDKDGRIMYGSEMELTKVSSYKDSREFKEILKYINTAPDKQRKGEKGYAK
jgi:SPP1 gp7 family putative phage head morphogenesis protein